MHLRVGGLWEGLWYRNHDDEDVEEGDGRSKGDDEVVPVECAEVSTYGWTYDKTSRECSRHLYTTRVRT